MLYLRPPFPVINGVAVFPDHTNERAFYYLPVAPHISTVRDPATGVDVPQIQLIKYRGDAGSGGFLTFQVDLGITEEAQDDIKGELRRMFPGDGPILLSPALLEDGGVKLMMLGYASDAQGNMVFDGEGDPRFVTKFQHSAKPALYGRNEAVFSVALDAEGVQLMEASMRFGELMPIGIVYTLDFFALRPAFTVKITADWNRVQSHLEESFGAEIFFASTDIDTVVDKLIEDQVIKIEVDTFLPEGDDAGSWVGRRDDAIQQFKDMVLDNFFVPSLEPIKEPEPDGWDKAAQFVERIALIGATGGWGGVAKFSYSKKDVTRIDQKRANLQMTERVTVKRSIYPQATMQGLAKVLQTHDISRFIQEVSLDDPWFERRKAKVHALVNFDIDEVAVINATLNYGGEPKTIRLTKDEPSGEVSWLSHIQNGKMVRELPYEYRITFRDVDSGERPGFLTSGILRVEGDEFEIAPRAEELYYIDQIQFGAGQLPWARYPQVMVETRYRDPANRIQLDDSFMLTEARPEAVWKRFRKDPDLNPYEVRITYLSQSHKDVVIDWTSTEQERLLIRDPYPQRRTVQVAPAVSWDLIDFIFVELSYSDPDNNIDEQATLSFFNTPNDKRPQTFAVQLADPDKRLVGYRITFVLKDNRTIEVPASMTAGSTIVLRTDMVGHKVVAVTPPQVDFARRQIERIEAELSYADPDAGLSYSDRMVFTKPEESGLFEFDYSAADRSRYTCKVTMVLTNGLVLERDLGSLGGDRLELPAP